MPFEGDLNQVLLRVLDALADSVRHLAGLAEAEAHGAVAVADNHQGGELEDTAALYGLAHAVDRNDALFQFRCYSFASNLAKVFSSFP